MQRHRALAVGSGQYLSGHKSFDEFGACVGGSLTARGAARNTEEFNRRAPIGPRILTPYLYSTVL